MEMVETTFKSLLRLFVVLYFNLELCKGQKGLGESVASSFFFGNRFDQKKRGLLVYAPFQEAPDLHFEEHLFAHKAFPFAFELHFELLDELAGPFEVPFSHGQLKTQEATRLRINIEFRQNAVRLSQPLRRKEKPEK